MSDINVGMKIFTVRELDRTPGKVLDAAVRDGVARVRRRDGRSFAIRPEEPGVEKRPDWKQFVREHHAWRKKLNPKPLAWTKEQVEELNRMIAGDGRIL